MDKLRLKGLVFYAHHGCTEEERTLGGRYEVDCELWMDLRKPGETLSIIFFLMTWENTRKNIPCSSPSSDLKEGKKP